MSKFQLPWEEERIKVFIDSFQCKVIDLMPLEEVRDDAGKVLDSKEGRHGD